MSGSNILDILSHPAAADPSVYTKGIEGLNALRDQQAKQASANAYRQATDPATGQVDVPKYNALIASGPGAWNAGQLMQQQGQAAGAQATAATGQFNLASAQNSATNAAATAALAAPDDQLHATVAQQVQRLIDANMIPRDKGMTWLANLSNDPAQMRQQLETIRVQTLPPQQQQDVIYGKPLTYTAPGGGLQGAVQDPRRGGALSGGGQPALPQGPSPDTLSEIVSLHTPGQPDQQMTRAQAITALRRNPALAPLNSDWNAPTVGGAGAAAGGPPTRGAATTPPPAALQSTAARADAAGTAAPKAGPIAYGSAGAPGQLAVKEQQATTGGAQAQQLESQGQDAATTTQPLLASMLTEMQGTGATGITSTLAGRARQFAVNLGLDPPAIDLTNQQASQEALGKLFAKYEQSQLAALGSSPSDSRQGLAAAGSPSLFNTAEGNRQIIRNLQGSNDALDLMYRSWMGSQTRANNPGNFAAWRSSFTAPVASGPLAGARFDPTVFSVNRMDPAEQRTYVANLAKASPADFAQFKKNWTLARQENWVPPLPGTTAAKAAARATGP